MNSTGPAQNKSAAGVSEACPGSLAAGNAESEKFRALRVGMFARPLFRRKNRSGCLRIDERRGADNPTTDGTTHKTFTFGDRESWPSRSFAARILKPPENRRIPVGSLVIAESDMRSESHINPERTTCGPARTRY